MAVQPERALPEQSAAVTLSDRAHCARLHDGGYAARVSALPMDYHSVCQQRDGHPGRHFLSGPRHFRKSRPSDRLSTPPRRVIGELLLASEVKHVSTPAEDLMTRSPIAVRVRMLLRVMLVLSLLCAICVRASAAVNLGVVN